MIQPRKRVSFLTHTVFHYREPFHERVHQILADHDIDYEVLSGQPDTREARKSDTVELKFGRRIVNRYLHLGSRRPPLILQPAWRRLRSADLAIVIQENRLLLNYPLQLLRGPERKVALFGHGRNFQARNPDSLAERWKRWWATRCDWWFAYTDATRRHIETLGFPPTRITVFDNAIDTRTARAAADAVGEADIAAVRRELGLAGDSMCVFVGGLYPDKRLEFLVAAADLVRRAVPDFELLVIGDGIDRPLLERLAEERPWLVVAGVRFGAEKAAMMRAGKLFLMPGLVGLAVLDAAAARLPVVTTAFPWHSPEIAYLKDGENAAIVGEWRSAEAYAGAVIELLRDDARRERLAQAASAMAERYTIEAMAERFAAGVVAALESRKT